MSQWTNLRFGGNHPSNYSPVQRDIVLLVAIILKNLSLHCNLHSVRRLWPFLHRSNAHAHGEGEILCQALQGPIIVPNGQIEWNQLRCIQRGAHKRYPPVCEILYACSIDQSPLHAWNALSNGISMAGGNQDMRMALGIECVCSRSCLCWEGKFPCN